MVSVSDPLTVENARTYYTQHYSAAAEYYAPTRDAAIGQAVGHGAELLGLGGPVTAEQFQSLLGGVDPHSGIMLRGRLNRIEANQRAGFDLTFSPPKSLSLQALVVGDARLIEIDRLAALRALQEAERCAFARQHGGSEWVQTNNICAVMFEHYDARESITGQHGPMPQLHHHTFITNLTQRPDGQWRSLDAEQIYRARPFIDAVYMTELSRYVQELGYGIVRGPDLSFELEGFTREQIEAFSERWQDIERRKAEKGITNAKAAREIVIETRKAKREHDPEVLKAEREKLAAEQGIRFDNIPRTPVRSFPTTPETQAEQSLDFALRHVTNKTAVGDHREIILAALQHGIGATDLDHVQAAMTARQQAGQMFAAGKSHVHPLDRYTTLDMVRLERENLKLVRNQMDHGRPVAGIAIKNPVDGKISTVGTDEVKEWIRRRKLLPEQENAAIMTLTTAKWANAIEGLAGTGKTYTIGAIKDFAEAHHWQLLGFGHHSGSRDELIDVGLDARTIAKALAAPLPPKTTHELWVIDESSLVATRQMNELLKLAIQRGVERIVLVGDQHQHLAIQAGWPLKQFLADNMMVTRLTTIQRQRDPELRKAVELAAAEKIAEAIDLLAEQKRIIEIPNTAERYEAIAADYLAGHEAGQKTLVVSPANDERRALNQVIRATLVAHQYVASIGQEHQILIPRDMTPAQLQHAHSYHEGDVLFFSRGSKKQAIPKAAYLTVASVNQDSLMLQAENGRLLQFDPSKLKGVRAYTTETRTIAVGDRLQWREPDNKRRIANGEYGTIKSLDRHNISVHFDKGRTLSMPLKDARKVDLGYASTSHAAQGSTVDRVISNIDSSRSVEIVNQRQAYVSWSRARIDAHIYTNDVHAMRRAVSRTQDKELALDVVEKPRQQRSAAMRIGL